MYMVSFVLSYAMSRRGFILACFSASNAMKVGPSGDPPGIILRGPAGCPSGAGSAALGPALWGYVYAVEG